MPVTRRARCCHWTLSRVKEQSSETRSPVSSSVQTISFSSTAPAGVGEPIGLLGPEGLADELVGHLLTCSGNVVGSQSVGDPELGSLSPRAGYQAADGDNSVSRPCFRPTWPIEEWEVEIGPSSRYYTEGELVFTVVAARGRRPMVQFCLESLPYPLITPRI